jgi:CheY-like chemotaxis protein
MLFLNVSTARSPADRAGRYLRLVSLRVPRVSIEPSRADMTDVLEAGERAPKMLVADDDPAVVRLLADRCAKMGFKVETATNGIQALIMTRRSQPDVLIVDVNMPEVDGLSVCARLLNPGRKPIKVVVVTGSADPETAERCESMGLFYGRKGPEFWSSISSALTEMFPDMADRIRGSETRSTAAGVRSRPCVLVVDDDPDVERFFSGKLDKCGVDTFYASDGVQGYRMARKEEPCVIISDYFMPNGDAHYLLCRLRGSPATEHVPVFVMSGQRLDELTEQSLKREISGRPGAARIFRKAFDTKELFDALQKVCGFERNRIE